MASTRTGYLAVKKESVKAVAVKPTNFIPIKDGKIKYNQETIENNPIKGVRWGNQQAVLGKINTDGAFNFDVDAISIGYFLQAVLGKYSKSTVEAGVYKHIFEVANDLPSYSFEQLLGNPEGVDYEVVRSFGVLLDSLELSASDGIVNAAINVKAHGMFLKGNLQADAALGTAVTVDLDVTEGLVATDAVRVTDKTNATSEDTSVTSISGTDIVADLANSYVSADDVKVELKPQTPNYDCEETIFTFSNASFKFGADLTAAAAAEQENVENWTLMFGNQLEERFGSLRATPSKIAPKSGMGMLKFTKFFESNEDRDRYLDRTRQACIFTLDLGVKIGASSETYKLVVKINDSRFTTYNMENGTDELLISEIEAPIFYSCEDGKEVSVELYNNVADYEV